MVESAFSHQFQSMPYGEIVSFLVSLIGISTFTVYNPKIELETVEGHSIS